MSLISYKIDFHTHSILSQDGGISEEDYKKILLEKKLNYIAITDHNEIDYAVSCQKKLGESIIVGEEITMNSGEIIGLFLTKVIPPFLSLSETIDRIKDQQGIVYIPHAFDTKRAGIGEKNLNAIKKRIDILETFNGRMVFDTTNTKAQNFAKENNIPSACASDAHSANGLGLAYTIVNTKINRTTLLPSLANALHNNKYLPLLAYFAPMYNKIQKYAFR